MRADRAATERSPCGLRALWLRRVLGPRQCNQRKRGRVVQRVRARPQLAGERKLCEERVRIARRWRPSARCAAGSSDCARHPSVSGVLRARQFERQVRCGAITGHGCAIGAQLQEESRRRFAGIGVAPARTRFSPASACELRLRCKHRDTRIAQRRAGARRHRRQLIRCTHLAERFETAAHRDRAIAARRVATGEQHTPRQRVHRVRVINRRQPLKHHRQNVGIAARPQIRRQRPVRARQSADAPAIELAQFL